MSSLRVMTYNVHGCVGTDGRLDLARIVQVIGQHEPHVVALQELDEARERSGRNRQAKMIADELGMAFHFHPAWHIREDEQYGDAILSRLPLRLVKAGALPTVKARRGEVEPRGALWVEVEKDGVAFQIINTHLGLCGRERLLQMEALTGSEWMGHPACWERALLCGDLNALPGSRVYRMACKRMRDTQRSGGVRARTTFPSWFTLLRLDYVFATPELHVEKVLVGRSALDRVASDHLPLVVDVRR